MRILYLASSSDWHIDLWTQYFVEKHEVFLFSDKEDYLKDQGYKGVRVFQSESFLGSLINWLNVKSHRIHQFNKLVSARFYSDKIDQLISEHKIDMVHAHSVYYGYVASFIKSDIPIIFTPMGSDVIIHAQVNPIYKYMAKQAYQAASIVTGDSLLKQSRGFLLGARKSQNYIVQNGVDTKIFRSRQNNLKQEMSLSDDCTLIFSPRAVTPLYNIDTIKQ